MVQVDERVPFQRRRPCACCCGIVFCLILLIGIIIIILAFTVFKVKKADISVEKVELQDFKANLGRSGLTFKPSINITLAVVVSVHNPNRASFKYTNSSAIVYYYEDEVAVVPIPAGTIGSQGTETISTTLELLADKLISNSHLVGDFLADSLPFTLKLTLSGRVKVLFVKRHVDISTMCSISVSVNKASITNTDCKNKVHL